MQKIAPSCEMAAEGDAAARISSTGGAASRHEEVMGTGSLERRGGTPQTSAHLGRCASPERGPWGDGGCLSLVERGIVVRNVGRMGKPVDTNEGLS
jgi:hypothetical protein